MKKAWFILSLCGMSLMPGRAESPMPAESDTLVVRDSIGADTTATLPAAPADSLHGWWEDLLPDSLRTDSTFLAADTLGPAADSLHTDHLPADSLTADSIRADLLIGEALRGYVELPHVESINLDEYQFDAETDSAAIAASMPPPPPPTLIELMGRGEVIRSMIPDSIVVDSAFLASLDFTPTLLDPSVYERNPLFCELVYMGKDVSVRWRDEAHAVSFYYGQPALSLTAPCDTIPMPDARTSLAELRQQARDYIMQTDASLYTTTHDQLPKLTWNTNRTISSKPLRDFALEDRGSVPVISSDRIVPRRKKMSNWSGRLHTLVQFSQTALSKNWHQGGYDFFSLLGALSGNLNYDNRKMIRWENSFEWRTGFNTVTGDTIGAKGGRRAMPSDDIFKVYSKFGLKALGNFYYSTTLDFQTNLFSNPKGINNYEMKARFLTPIRLNIGVGMEYKYKQLSVNLAPLSFKYIYLNDTTVTEDGFFINPNEFGIQKGENQLKEFGSRLTLELRDYRPIEDLRLNSRLNFYTNYKKVEIDWEIVVEYAINRFLSTRLMLNPRFDNTVIFQDDEKARLQMKEMLTVGISYRIL